MKELAALFDECHAFEASLPSHIQDLHGVFYTPLPLAHAMTEAALGNDDGRSPPRVLDPSCGAGVFLLNTFHLLSKRYPPDQVLSTMIFGIDIDPHAVALARKLLAAAYRTLVGAPPTEGWEKNIAVGDFLVDPLRFTTFTHLIGNPPYGLSREGKISPELNSFLKKRYASLIDGKPNKYLLFIARALELLSERGTLAFVVPNSWLGIRGGRKVRRVLLEENLLEEIWCFSEKVFDEPGVEPVVVMVRRGRAPDHSFSIQMRSETGELLRSAPLSPEVCLQNPDAVIPLSWSSEVQRYFEVLDKLPLKLGGTASPFSPSIALQVYAKGKGTPPQTQEVVDNHPFHGSDSSAKNAVRYLQGKSISRFSHTWFNEWLSYGPWIAEFQPIEKYSVPRVVLREVTGKYPHLLRATLLTDPFTYNRSVLHVHHRAHSVRDLTALLAILNSELISWILLKRGRKTQRDLFPKIVADDLHDLPLPEWSTVMESPLSLWGEEMMRTPSQELEERINSMVLALYGLPEGRALP